MRFITFLFAASLAFGQTITDLPSNVLIKNIPSSVNTNVTAARKFSPQAASAPGACVKGERYFDTTLGVERVCTATNTWTTLLLTGSVGSLASLAVSGAITGGSISLGGSPPALTPGTGSADAMTEGTVPIVGAAAAVDVCYADLTAHGILCSFNNGAYSQMARYADKLNAFAATSSAEFAGIISNETGTGGLVFADSPTFTTRASMGTGYLSTSKTAGSIGTTANLLVKIDSTGNVVTAAVSDVGVLGVAAATAASTVAVEVATRGIINCIADNTTVIGNVAVVGTSTAGRCKDSGQVDSTGLSMQLQVIGKFLTVATVGNAASLQLYGPGHYGAGAATAAQIPATPVPTPGTTITLVAPRGYAICTGTCTVTVPVPAAGYEFCIVNDDNVATAITLSALGSSAMYEGTARTAYGTAGTGTLAATAAAGNKVCLVGRDATHYLTLSYVGTWTAN